jgi:hypothetical protein
MMQTVDNHLNNIAVAVAAPNLPPPPPARRCITGENDSGRWSDTLVGRNE